MQRAAAAFLSLVVLSPAAHAAQPQFWEIEGAPEFLSGELQGLSIDADGRVRLAPAAPVLHNPSCPYVWTVARDAHGTVYAGTGNDGRVVRVVDGQATVFFDAAELEVHALAVGRDGRLYVGTSPDGKVYAVGKDGKSETFFDPEDRYIWALAFDKKGNLLVATGGDGKVYRVDPSGKQEIMLEGTQEHITALIQDAQGRIIAGSSPDGIVYRIDPDDKKVSVLLDTAFHEVKSLSVDADGNLYAALVEGKDAPGAAPSTTSPAASAGGAVAEVTVSESLLAIVTPAPVPAPNGPRTVESLKPGQAKGAVLKLSPSGETDTIWASSEELPFALLRTSKGLLLGTGSKAKIYRLTDDRTWTMLTTLPVEQITALDEGGHGDLVVATSNPGALYSVGAAPRPEGVFISKVKDTETTSSWGRILWHTDVAGQGSVRIATRSGNTGAPDNTWSDWSPLSTRSQGEGVTSPRARFLQIKAVLTGKDGATPVLDQVRVAYLQRNLRPQVTSITVHAPGEVFQKPLSVTAETEILGYDAESPDSPERVAARAAAAAMPATSYSRKLYQKGLQTFSWKAEDPNGDVLLYDVDYRPVGDKHFRPLRKGLDDSVLVWDTSTVPNGRYVVRIVARDQASNPSEMVLAGDKESAPFEIDNTPPVVTASLSGGGRVHAVATDDSSLIRKLEYSLDGGRWEEVHPGDGIDDSLEETYDFAPAGLTTGPHVVVLRATDLLGNASTARVEIK